MLTGIYTIRQLSLPFFDSYSTTIRVLLYETLTAKLVVVGFEWVEPSQAVRDIVLIVWMSSKLGLSRVCFYLFLIVLFIREIKIGVYDGR